MGLAGVDWNSLESFLGLFGSVVAVTFQIVFRAKMHANDIFFIF
jgi:hypothetical protein